MSESSVEGRARREAFLTQARAVGLGECDALVWGEGYPEIARYARPDAPTPCCSTSANTAGNIPKACDRFGVVVLHDLFVVVSSIYDCGLDFRESTAPTRMREASALDDGVNIIAIDRRPVHVRFMHLAGSNHPCCRKDPHNSWET